MKKAVNGRLGVILFAVGASMAGNALAARNVVLNGGFEDNPLARGQVSPDRGYFCYKNFVNTASTQDHWTQSGSEDSCYYRGGTDGVVPAAYAGSYAMNINDGTGPEIIIRQAVPLVGGTPYTLSFAVAGFNGQSNVGQLTVKLGGDFEQTIAPRPVSEGWLTYNFGYTPAADGNLLLSFAATDARIGSVVIDDVSLTPVPEPGTWALLAAGLAGVSVVGRHARRLSAT